MTRRIFHSDLPANGGQVADQREDQEQVRLTLYTRRGCHLCAEMSQLLHEFSADYTYIVDSVDIDSDPALRERFNVLVPALYRGDDEICHHYLDLTRLQAALLTQTA